MDNTSRFEMDDAPRRDWERQIYEEQAKEDRAAAGQEASPLPAASPINAAAAHGEENEAETDDDMEQIGLMLDRAKKYGLQVECVYHFAGCIKNGDAIPKACAAAIYEWDL